MSFVDFARAHGLTILRLDESDRIRRCPTEDKPRSNNGAYLWDGGRGWVFNWEVHTEVQWYDNPDKRWTPSEKDALRRRTVAADLQRRQMDVALRSERLLAECELKEHNYLHMKGLKEERGLVDGDVLLVPMRDWHTYRVLGTQSIWWDEASRKYQKKMSYGMRAKGAVYWIGDRSSREPILCEGYATGLSIYAAIRAAGLRRSVLVCFSAGNLIHVAKQMDGISAAVFADNDASGAGERAAKETGMPYCMSDVVGQDANDVHVQRGLLALVGMVMKLRGAK